MPMADSIIYTTAKLNDAIVWTQDSDFKGFESVKYFVKKLFVQRTFKKII